jgi:hypothetical protein
MLLEAADGQHSHPRLTLPLIARGRRGEFQGSLGNLPVATQRFLQEPFQHDVVMDWGFRAQRTRQGPSLKEQVWCWIEGGAFFTFAYAHRSTSSSPGPAASEELRASWLARAPWTVAASSAVLAPDLCSRTVHDLVAGRTSC